MIEHKIIGHIMIKIFGGSASKPGNYVKEVHVVTIWMLVRHV